ALSEQAASNPEGTFFLWEGRAFSYAQADRRVDNIVRGLIRCGVRRGEPIAVLMGPRPSYLSVTAALSRLGAVPILLSPDRDVATLREAIHGSAPRFLIADPQSAALGKELLDEVLVLGAAHEQRALPSGVTDMELIDPDTVELPGWYEPNPGCARDLALIMLTAGRGKKPRAALGVLGLRRRGGMHVVSSRHRVLLPAPASPGRHVGGRRRRTGRGLPPGARDTVRPRRLLGRYSPLRRDGGLLCGRDAPRASPRGAVRRRQREFDPPFCREWAPARRVAAHRRPVRPRRYSRVLRRDRRQRRAGQRVRREGGCAWPPTSRQRRGGTRPIRFRVRGVQS
ncbi:MAG: AMP-binding protein, partial [Deltaproteobacteria bacterium]|nr:AMP-binding protein [Deltaproteobacteria bacterium]